MELVLDHALSIIIHHHHSSVCLWWLSFLPSPIQATVKIDPHINDIVTNKFPSQVASPRADKFGFPKDASVEEIVQQFVDEFFDDEMMIPPLHRSG